MYWNVMKKIDLISFIAREKKYTLKGFVMVTKMYFT